MLYLDTETRSGTDIKLGAYRYVEDPDFEIQVTAWAFDDDPVRVTEGVPDEVVEYLWEQKGPVIAHNSGFDRVALSQHLRPIVNWADHRYLNPDLWVEDTLFRARLYGYPGSLKNLAKALGAEDKDEAGTRLIKKFAVPPFADPQDHPEDWQAYKEYCRQDVATLRDIDHRLPRMTEFERLVAAATERMNDRGTRVDIWAARALNDQYISQCAANLSRMREITGLENPNSVQQLTRWLSDRLGEPVKSVAKPAVAALRERPDLPEDVDEVLTLKAYNGLSTAKKFCTILDRVCADDRIRGEYHYCGAQESGRWCLTGDHEVLTTTGWVRMDQWDGGAIACWDKQRRFSFKEATCVSFPYTGRMIRLETQGHSQLSTEEHRMVRMTRGRNPHLVEETVGQMYGKRVRLPRTGVRQMSPRGTEAETRALVMVQADGHFTRKGALTLHFRKPRKIRRCRENLGACAIPYRESLQSDGSTLFRVRRKDVPLFLSLAFTPVKTWGPWILDLDPEVLFDELRHWDGCNSRTDGSTQYVSVKREDADWIQAAAQLSGRRATVTYRKETESYCVSVWHQPAPYHTTVSEDWGEEEFQGRVYCAETPTGFFLVRRNGKAWITGNSMRGAQWGNLSHDDQSVEHWEAQMADVSLGKVLSADELRAMIRPLIMGPFTVGDESQIEFRMMAGIVGDETTLQAFRDKEDLYTVTARSMGPGFTRSQGKTASLAMQYLGGVGALKAFGGEAMVPPGEDVDSFLWGVVNAWRDSHPHQVEFGERLMRDFISGSGLCESSGPGHRAMVLPSGRRLHYYDVRKGWDHEYDRVMYTYRGARPGQREAISKNKLVGRYVQGSARDLLAEVLVAMDREGIPVVMLVHDEAVVEGDDPETQAAVQRIMETHPAWMPPGIPLNAEPYTCDRYVKE